MDTATKEKPEKASQTAIPEKEKQNLSEELEISPDHKLNENIEEEILKETDQKNLKEKHQDKHKEKHKEKKKKKSEIEKLQDKIKEKDAQIAEQKQKYMYLNAELDNAKKIYLKQSKTSQNRARANTILSFTPLIDSFEMALKNKEEVLEKKDPDQMVHYIHGFEAIYKKLMNIFKSFKLETIDKSNVPFDYRIHEVMMKLINDDVPEDTVLQIAQKGYKINGDILRPAKVIVSKKTPEPPKPEPSKPELIKSDQEENESSKLEQEKTEPEESNVSESK